MAKACCLTSDGGGEVVFLKMSATIWINCFLKRRDCSFPFLQRSDFKRSIFRTAQYSGALNSSHLIPWFTYEKTHRFVHEVAIRKAVPFEKPCYITSKPGCMVL